MTKARKMPPLGAGSVDLDAVHAADRRGEDLHKAIEQARVRDEPAAAAASPTPASPVEKPAVSTRSSSAAKASEG